MFVLDTLSIYFQRIKRPFVKKTFLTELSKILTEATDWGGLALKTKVSIAEMEDDEGNLILLNTNLKWNTNFKSKYAVPPADIKDAANKGLSALCVVRTDRNCSDNKVTSITHVKYL